VGPASRCQTDFSQPNVASETPRVAGTNAQRSTRKQTTGFEEVGVFGARTSPVSAASSTGRCKTIQSVDPTLLPLENGRTRSKPSQGNVSADLI
jgi:hypothetical protein